MRINLVSACQARLRFFSSTGRQFTAVPSGTCRIRNRLPFISKATYSSGIQAALILNDLYIDAPVWEMDCHLDSKSFVSISPPPLDLMFPHRIPPIPAHLPRYCIFLWHKFRQCLQSWVGNQEHSR